MSKRRNHWILKSLTTVAATVALVVVALAQERPRQNRGRLRHQGGVPLKKVRPKAGDPLANAPGGEAKAKKKGGADALAPGSFYYTFKLHSFDGAILASSYYPSKLGMTAPVLMLIHEANRSRKDFEEPVEELKGQGLAEHLQAEGYAVFSMDLRGQGQNQRHRLTENDRTQMAADLQAAYFFLLDRHNRGDFNIAKLGVVALGDGANLCVAWAALPSAASSVEGRASDLSAMVLISPYRSTSWGTLQREVESVAQRIPLALLAGSRDKESKEAVEGVRQLVTRGRLNKVELFPSSLHGYRLMRLEPKLSSTITRFLEATTKLRAADWEPRYNLDPVTVSDVLTVQNPRRQPPKPEAKKAQAKDAEKAKAEPKPKNENAGKGNPPKER